MCSGARVLFFTASPPVSKSPIFQDACDRHTHTHMHTSSLSLSHVYRRRRDAIMYARSRFFDRYHVLSTSRGRLAKRTTRRRATRSAICYSDIDTPSSLPPSASTRAVSRALGTMAQIRFRDAKSYTNYELGGARCFLRTSAHAFESCRDRFFPLGRG